MIGLRQGPLSTTSIPADFSSGFSSYRTRKADIASHRPLLKPSRRPQRKRIQQPRCGVCCIVGRLVQPKIVRTQRLRAAGGDHGRALMATLGTRPRRGTHVALAESGVKVGTANEAQMARVLTKGERARPAARAPRPPVRSSPVRTVKLLDDQKDFGARIHPTNASSSWANESGPRAKPLTTTATTTIATQPSSKR